MKSAKYTLIALGLLGVFYLWGFIGALVEKNWPTQPIYYIASVIEIGLGYLTVKLQERTSLKRQSYLILLMSFLCFSIPIACYYSSIEFLKPIGGAQTWFIISSLGFLAYSYIKKRRLKKEMTEGEQVVEDTSKGVLLLFLVLAIIFLPMILLIFLITSC